MITKAMTVLMISPTNSRPSIGCGIRLHLERGTKLLRIKGIVDESFIDPEILRTTPARLRAVTLIEKGDPREPRGALSTERGRLVPELFTDRAVPVSTAALVLREGVAAIAELDPNRLRRKLGHGGRLGGVRGVRPQICSGLQSSNRDQWKTSRICHLT
jgi:hypothetical protein